MAGLRAPARAHAVEPRRGNHGRRRRTKHPQKGSSAHQDRRERPAQSALAFGMPHSRTTMAFPPLPGFRTGNRGDPSPPAYRRGASDRRQPRSFVARDTSTRKTSEMKLRFQQKNAPTSAHFYPNRWINGERQEGECEQEVGNEARAPQGVLLCREGQERQGGEGDRRSSLGVGAHREAEVGAAGEVG